MPREDPSFIAFARENGTVYHTYTVTAPDPFVAPCQSSLEHRTPRSEPRVRRPTDGQKSPERERNRQVDLIDWPSMNR
jgi:hypothetical protein